jgi:hypothetical protein
MDERRCGLFLRYYGGKCIEGLKKITKILRAADVPGEIQTHNLPNII